MACKRTLVIGSAQYAMSVAGGGSRGNRLVNGAPNYAMVIVCTEGPPAETFFRLLEDGTSRRLLEDGTSRRLLEIAP